MQQQLIQQLDEAVSEVFALMLNRDCRPGRCSLAPLPSRSPADASVRQLCTPGFTAPGGLSALISFSGSLRGACSVHLALRTAAIITGQLLGEPYDESSTLTADTTGELCNMIAGSWKSRQPCDTSACALSAPLISTEELTCPPAPAQTFRHTLVRTYRFEEHCLRLHLAFD